MIEGAQLPIAILMVQSSTPVLVYNKTESFDSNMLRILIESGLNRDEAVKNCHRYTLIGHLMDKTNFDARDDPYMMHMCEMVTYQFMQLHIKKYSDDEIRQRESRESTL